MNCKRPALGFSIFLFIGLSIMLARGDEVNKGEIPPEHLDKSLKTTPWNTAIWDVEDALPLLKEKDETILWVDTRPDSFFSQGTVKDAILLVYDQKDAEYPDGTPVLTKESLEDAIGKVGNVSKIAFFCQGPKCHRSYNASWRAVSDWGFDPDMVVWFRDGYPELFKTVSEDAKLSRRANRYLSDSGAAALQ